jgi:uncharacterized membrane protein YdbT with pleckstrin-like domain
MVISAKLLGEDEYVVASTRTHWKALVFPVFLLLVVAGGGGFLAALVPDGGVQGPARIAIAVAGVLVLVIWALRPFLDWFFSTYTLTNRRLITRRGVFTRTGLDMPLYRINDVRSERGVIDRILGCGTLVVSAASDLGTTTLPDVPRVEQVQLAITELLFPEADHRGDEGDPGHHPLEPGPYGSGPGSR